MPWRTLEFRDQRWNVAVAAERRANSSRWNLVLSFRAAGVPRRSVWAQYPLESTSKAHLFQQADRLTPDDLKAALAERLG